MPLVDRVADGLADEMVGNGERGQLVIGEDLPALLAVPLVGHGAVDIEMIPPTGQLEAVVAEVAWLSRTWSRGAGRPTGR